MARDQTAILTTSEADTMAAGRDLARSLEPGAVVLLHGDLGTGKTVFVRGLAQGLDIDPDEVSSPTFTLVQEYRHGRLPLIHVDLYRLNNPREVDDLGLDELGADGVLAIEWAEKLPRRPPESIVVGLEHRGTNERAITIRVDQDDP